jgi:hypothetical protein
LSWIISQTSNEGNDLMAARKIGIIGDGNVGSALERARLQHERR